MAAAVRQQEAWLLCCGQGPLGFASALYESEIFLFLMVKMLSSPTRTKHENTTIALHPSLLLIMWFSK